jgi:hypothetical protein
MRQSFRQTAMIATAIVALGAISAVAAPPGASDPTATPSTMAPAGGTAAPMAPAGSQAQAQPNEQAANSGQMEARIDQRISDLQGKLQISAAQKPQWDHFTQIMRENAREMDKIFQARIQGMDNMNAEQNMKSYASIAQHHAQDVERLVPAFDALYAKMSESQKKTADQVFRDDANQGASGKNG